MDPEAEDPTIVKERRARLVALLKSGAPVPF